MIAMLPERLSDQMASVLVVDDTPTNVAILLDALEDDNLRVAIAQDGEEAIARAAYLQPDLILLDVIMPGLDGLETCRRLKANPDTARIPVIFMTALMGLGHATAGFEAGGVDYITKPFHIAEVLARVRTQLALITTHRALLERHRLLEEEIAARRAAEASLQISERRFRGLFETATTGILLFELDSGAILDCNAQAQGLLDTTASDIAGRIIDDLPLFRQQPSLRSALASLRASGLMPHTSCTLAPAGTGPIHLEVHGHVHAGPDGHVGQIALRDVTERSRAEERIRHMALHDSLTGLPNRAQFEQHLAEAVARAATAGREVALLLLNLDRFKLVNDAMGHQAADRFLCTVAERIRARVPAEALAARLGNDEFAVVLEDNGARSGAAALAERLLDGLSQTVEVQGQRLRGSASMGISLYPADGDRAETLLQTADATMQQAKRSQRGSYMFATRAIAEDARERARLAAELQEACEQLAFHQFYQPQFDLASGTLSGVETLIRWRRGDGAMVSPVRFVPLLEELGLIAHAGRQVVLRACAQAAQWRAAHPAKIRVAVNLSPREFYDANVVANVREALEASGLPADLLELEITESLPVSDTETAIRVMHDLKDLGVSLALDDFGTGWSSLSYLRRFPLDRIKIDQSFVKDLGTEPAAMTMVRSIVDLAGSLGFACVAEGVETTAQLECLRGIGCAEVQGYLFSPPLPAEACGELLGAGLVVPGTVATS